jgi:hypothetical protein
MTIVATSVAIFVKITDNSRAAMLLYPAANFLRFCEKE